MNIITVALQLNFLLTPSLFVGYSATLYNKNVLKKIMGKNITINTEDAISTESKIIADLSRSSH